MKSGFFRTGSKGAARGLLAGLALGLLWAFPLKGDSPLLDQLEWRGVMGISGEWIFSVRDRETGNTYWLEPGHSRAGIKVENYDREAGVLTLRRGERTGAFSLTAPQIASLPESSGETSAPGRETAATPEEARREAQQERSRRQRETMNEMMETWRAAVENSPELREVDGQIRELQEESRRLREEFREVDRDSEAFRELRERQVQVREDMSAVTSLALLQARNTEAFGDRLQGTDARLFRAGLYRLHR